MAKATTNDMVLLVVRDATRRLGGGVSAPECAKHLGISESTARKYLVGFTRSGHARAVRSGRSVLYVAQ